MPLHSSVVGDAPIAVQIRSLLPRLLHAIVPVAKQAPMPTEQYRPMAVPGVPCPIYCSMPHPPHSFSTPSSIGSCLHSIMQGEPRGTSSVQALSSSGHRVGQLPSQISLPSMTPLPQRGGHTASHVPPQPSAAPPHLFLQFGVQHSPPRQLDELPQAFPSGASLMLQALP
jgi:hypothetical protein